MSADPTTSAHAAPSVPPSAASEPLDAVGDPQSLVDRVMREVSELSGLAEEAATAPQVSASDSNEAAGFDLSALEREIESLLQNSSQTSAQEVVTQEEALVEGAVESVEMTSSSATEVPGGVTTDASPSIPSAAIPPDELESLAEVLDPARRDTKPSIAATAFEAEPIDPVQREIEATLADDTTALLEACGGDLDAALGSVFDPRVLAGQEEDINRALIEAFGSSRIAWRSGEPAVVTNPAPEFSDGPSRAMPPETPRVELDRQVAAATEAAAPVPGVTAARGATDGPRVAGAPTAPPVTDRPVPPRSFEELGAASIAREQAPEYAGETPFEPAFPAVPIVPAAPVGESATVTAPDAAGAKPTADTSTAPSTVAAPTQPPPQHQPRPRPPSRIGPLLRRLAELPLAVAAAPMRALPESARTYTGLVAVTLLLMVPLAWWLAHAKAGARGVGPVTFTGVAAGAGGDSADPSSGAGDGH
ncbi:MAG: hypothetical protein RI967_386 [Planctomycetota bacterium]